MKYQWLSKKNSLCHPCDLIVFFNGWGMDEGVVSHLDCLGFDVLMLYDYRDYTMPFFDFSMYAKKYLVAWSMGVALSSCMHLDFIQKIAFNGTQKPIDNRYGIPKKMYALTIKHFNAGNRKKFMEKAGIQQNSSRSDAELKEELIAIQNFVPDKLHIFDKVYISVHDTIFTPQNQVNYWQNCTKIVKMDSYHYPFFHFHYWSDIFNA